MIKPIVVPIKKSGKIKPPFQPEVTVIAVVKIFPNSKATSIPILNLASSRFCNWKWPKYLVNGR